MSGLPLHGRNHELDVVSAAVEGARRGEGRVLVIEGEAGIGKTRLLAEATDIGERAGLSVASGACDVLDELAPLAPLLAALGTAGRSVLPADLQESAPVRSDRRMALLDRLGALLEEQARLGPLLVTLDDLQWADATTLVALRVLTLQLGSYPVVWILARRTHPTSVALERTIGQLQARGAGRLVLEALDDDAVASIVRDLLDARPDTSVLSFVGGASGNPFYLTELVTAARRDGGITIHRERAALVEARPPPAFRDVVASQLAYLSPAARELLELGALLGRSFQLRDVAELLDRPPVQLAAPLTEALAAAIIGENGPDLVFRHDLLREALYERITVSLREALHLQVARRLLARGASPAEVAWHLARAARRGDRETLEVLERAADELVPTAPGAAADIKVTVLALLDDDSPQWARTAGDAMRLLAVSGRPHEAEAIAEGALEGPLEPIPRAALQIGRCHALNIVGYHRLVAPLVRPILETPGLPDELSLAAVGLAAAALLRSGDPQAAAVIEHERELSTRLDNREHIVTNFGNRSNLAAREGELDLALRLATEENEMAASGEPARLTAQAPRLSLAFHLMLRDQLEEARAHLDAAERIARRVGFPWAVMLCEQARAGALLLEGQLDAAAAIAEAATEDARAVDLEPRTTDLLHVLAQVAVRRGDLAIAREYADRLEFLLSEGGSLVATVTNTVSGRLAFAEGDPARALRDLAPAYDSPNLLALMRNDCPLAPELVRIALAAAAPGRASVVVAAAQRYAERNPSVASLGAQSLHASGMLHNDVAQLREALARYQSSPRMLARPIAADDLADALLEGEQADEAISLLRQAGAEFTALGARRDADRVRAKLRTLGVRTRTSTAAARPPTGWDALTPAEQGVARLAAEALTNRQIADRLFLSPHTVTTHLRHVFAKLAIRSRVELVRLVPG